MGHPKIKNIMLQKYFLLKYLYNVFKRTCFAEVLQTERCFAEVLQTERCFAEALQTERCFAEALQTERCISHPADCCLLILCGI